MSGIFRAFLQGGFFFVLFCIFQLFPKEHVTFVIIVSPFLLHPMQNKWEFLK